MGETTKCTVMPCERGSAARYAGCICSVALTLQRANAECAQKSWLCSHWKETANLALTLNNSRISVVSVCLWNRTMWSQSDKRELKSSPAGEQRRGDRAALTLSWCWASFWNSFQSCLLSTFTSSQSLYGMSVASTYSYNPESKLKPIHELWQHEDQSCLVSAQILFNGVARGLLLLVLFWKMSKSITWLQSLQASRLSLPVSRIAFEAGSQAAGQSKKRTQPLTSAGNGVRSQYHSWTARALRDF